MPNFNSYFYLLKQDITSGNFKIFSSERVALKVSKPYWSDTEQREVADPYAIVFLSPYQKPMLIDGGRCEIGEHHMTIYEKFRREAGNSLYHYTAELLLSDNPCKLHVYFDGQDQVIDLKTTLKDELGKIMPLTENQRVLFSQMAITHTTPFRSQLRKFQQSTIHELTNRLNIILENIFKLPVHDKESQKFCLSEIDSLLQQAQDLIDCGGSKNVYQILMRYKKTIEWKMIYLMREEAAAKASPQMAREYRDDDVVESVSGTLEDSRLFSEIKPEKTAEQMEQEKNALLLAELKEKTEAIFCIERECNSSNKASSALVYAYNEAARVALGFLLECPDSEEIINYTNVIYKALADSQALCVSRLREAMVLDDEPSIQCLKGFAALLSDESVVAAIGRNKPEQLEMLLETGAFPVNQIQSVNRAENQACSLLEFSMNKKHHECFSILLKHGADYMVNGRDDLPLIHHVFMQRRGPFYAAVIEHFNVAKLKQINQRLIDIVSARLAQPDLPEADRETLSLVLEEYKLSMRVNAEVSRSQGGSQSLRQVQQSTDTISNSLTDAQLSAIQQSPEIGQKKAELVHVMNELIPDLNPRERRAVTVHARNKLKRTASVMQAYGVTLTEEMVSGGLDIQIQQARDVARIRQLQGEIIQFNNGPGGYKKKVPGHIKKKEQECNSLIQKVRAEEKTQNDMLEFAEKFSNMNSLFQQAQALLDKLAPVLNQEVGREEDAIGSSASSSRGQLPLPEDIQPSSEDEQEETTDPSIVDEKEDAIGSLASSSREQLPPPEAIQLSSEDKQEKITDPSQVDEKEKNRAFRNAIKRSWLCFQGATPPSPSCVSTKGAADYASFSPK